MSEPGTWRAEFDRRLRMVAEIPDHAHSVTCDLRRVNVLVTEVTYDSGEMVVWVNWSVDTPAARERTSRSFELGELLRRMDAVPDPEETS